MGGCSGTALVAGDGGCNMCAAILVDGDNVSNSALPHSQALLLVLSPGPTQCFVACS